VKVWKLYRKRRLPVLRARPYKCVGKTLRAAVPLSGGSGRPNLPRHWNPKADAEEMARIREELAIMAELDRYTIIW